MATFKKIPLWKKELIGNFKREGKVMAVGQPKSLDRDFATFSDGQIVPHGIYDVTKNVGYMTIGTSHDTPKFCLPSYPPHAARSPI